jgi:glycosyltransferase involved in cell wall biosynthesis
MSGPLVTIVTPSYNQGRFIRATIESVLSQGYPDIEYIIMDGGSTDETASVVKDYASRLTFISESDRGQSHAINKGFQVARGSILAWLNSDDLYLPGSVRTAVEAFGRNPLAGAIYGEGYLIDHGGHVSSRFPCTQPFDLWKLTHLSDYILQQTVYFRKDVLDDVGYLDEDLHYTMDWDVLIRIGLKYPLEYVPEYMGCLREYPEAKTSAGGARRIRELREMLSRHTGTRFSPGYVVYGLETYHRIWCSRVDGLFTPKLRPISDRLQSVIRMGAGMIIGHTIHKSQGLYSDGWAGKVLRYMLPPGSGAVMVEGSLPTCNALRGQTLHVQVNGTPLGEFDLPFGDFRITIPLPPKFQAQMLNLKIKASQSFMPGRFALSVDRRRLAYLLKSIRWVQSSSGIQDPALTVDGADEAVVRPSRAELQNTLKCP